MAPSLAQASVAAVLRNGYMTHKGTSEEGLLSIDLSSERVRKALTLLEGVQEGQSLNALLGYLFEEGLHGHVAGTGDRPCASAGQGTGRVCLSYSGQSADAEQLCGSADRGVAGEDSFAAGERFGCVPSRGAEGSGSAGAAVGGLPRQPTILGR